MIRHDDWFIHVDMLDKRLFDTRGLHTTSSALNPCDMTPDDVDYEMSTGKHPHILEIHGMNQESLEHFVTHYGMEYEYLSLFHCQLISDLSPLADLPKLKGVDINWNIRTDRLWDMSRNSHLTYLGIMDCKKITQGLNLLQSGQSLEELSVCGSIFTPYPMDSLSSFGGLPNLKHLHAMFVKPSDKDPSFLETLPALETFDFEAGLFTTEQIAYLCVRYPDLGGRFMGPFGPDHPGSKSFMRVSGYRKPTLEIPEQQAALDKHVAKFNALMEQYRAELKHQS
jgi:hypothetical protein